VSPYDVRRNHALKVIYVTAQLPYGPNEPFIIPEIIELGRQGISVTVVPTRPLGSLVHDDAHPLLDNTVITPLFSVRVLGAAALELTQHPGAAVTALLNLAGSRSLRIFLKNLAVYPKGLWLGRYARRTAVEHIHAHWAGTSSTLAMVASGISGTPWSLTTHRWDIVENNLLSLKARRACFMRAVTERGANDLREIVRDTGWHPWLLRMGVSLPYPVDGGSSPPELPARVLMPANFLHVKGHVHLVDAVAALKRLTIPIRVELAGDGPLESAMKQRVADLGLHKDIVFLGRLSHAQLLSQLRSGRWHIVVLPSVVTASGEHEGLPVSLIEAMACGIPTVSTESGGIPELLGGGAGILVPPGDADALADALSQLAQNPVLRRELGARGRARVEEEFDIERIAAKLAERLHGCRRKL
jgi:colanic acid/amylovoran biosynthesis glycosyltransferase